jgi:hypothetical protein
VVWEDLEHATRCIDLNREGLLFWGCVRAISVSVVKTVYGPPEGGLRLAYRVFAGLHEVLANLRAIGVPPQLQWLRLAPLVWQGLDNMDALGMFYLSRLHSIPFVRFHSLTGKGLSSYISKGVRDVITKRPFRVHQLGWTLTGLESLCSRGDGRVQALRRKRKGDIIRVNSSCPLTSFQSKGIALL